MDAQNYHQQPADIRHILVVEGVFVNLFGDPGCARLWVMIPILDRVRSIFAPHRAAPFRADLFNCSRLSEGLFLEEEEPGDER